MIRPAFLLCILAAAPATARDRLPPDAPYCARPGTPPIFIAPMGEPFRAAPGQAYPSAAWFTAADRNRDGRIDRAEFVADADRFFRLLDRDHDGRLTPEEITAYEADVAPEIALYAVRGREMVAPGRRAPRNGESDYGGPMGAGGYSWLNIPEPVASADADIDRVVTEREFAGAAGRRFETLDAAGNGVLTLKDLPSTPAQRAIEGPCRPRPKPRGTDRAREKELREEEREGRPPR
ncbi:EF-hand domain-containing protein [Sphingomonas bacterium]|uniref:EF-hand domain-containing protein n=1 Tax=Sphingomonas bacterium TaxID=1895847 RepID=UPI0020C60FAD|nr:EF-hand domain-containing protein [Sphingomonas bacterium]